MFLHRHRNHSRKNPQSWNNQIAPSSVIYSLHYVHGKPKLQLLNALQPEVEIWQESVGSDERIRHCFFSNRNSRRRVQQEQYQGYKRANR